MSLLEATAKAAAAERRVALRVCVMVMVKKVSDGWCMDFGFGFGGHRHMIFGRPLGERGRELTSPSPKLLNGWECQGVPQVTSQRSRETRTCSANWREDSDLLWAENGLLLVMVHRMPRRECVARVDDDKLPASSTRLAMATTPIVDVDERRRRRIGALQQLTSFYETALHSIHCICICLVQ